VINKGNRRRSAVSLKRRPLVWWALRYENMAASQRVGAPCPSWGTDRSYRAMMTKQGADSMAPDQPSHQSAQNRSPV
jgi:hypothetical protein